MTYTKMHMSLHSAGGQRLYLTQPERIAFLREAATRPPADAALCRVLAMTGCRISEALNLLAHHIDTGEQAIVFESLKKRRKHVFRAVPIPETLIRDLLRLADISGPRLWGLSRTTAYRKIKEIMQAAGISPGPHQCPKGLRHGFGVAAVLNHVPLGKLRSWMGHSRIETVAIYTNALGPEERQLAAPLWEGQEVLCV